MEKEGPCLWSLFRDQRRRAARRKEESGGEKERATAGVAGRDAIPPTSDSSIVEEGGQLDRRVVFRPEMMFRDVVFREQPLLL